MEKIYMEENNNNQQSKAKLNFSIVLSFCVAIFAIVSLVAVGFDQVSYAAETPTPGDSSRATLDSFIFKTEMASSSEVYLVRLSTDDDFFGVPIYYREENGNKIPIFCVEHDIVPAYNETYTISTNFDEATYYGVLYILSRSKSVKATNSGISGSTGRVEDMATQVAIWAYLYDKKGQYPHSLVMDNSSNSESGQAKRNVIRNFTSYTDSVMTGSIELIAGLNNKINDVVEQAKSASKERKLQINYSSKNLSKTSDGSNYQSAEFSVSEITSSGSLVSYDVEATGIDGVKVVNEKGEEKTNFAPADKFYIQVPADKVTTSVKNINIKVTGTFDGVYAGTYYVNSGHQTVVTVTETTVVDDDTLVLEVAGSPDTSMNSVQTVYFIGLIVLLCGIGIIYANAKPVEEK